MQPQDAEAILTICLMAAFADGTRSDSERQAINEVGKNLGVALSPAMLQRVVTQQITVAEATGSLSADARALAYEMAVHVCDADGTANAAEAAFLRELEAALGLASGAASEVRSQSTALIKAPVAADVRPLAVEPQESDIDAMILRYAILNGALELLPQSIATLAIIPLQTRMVYRVGKAYGIALDRGHIAEFIATVGIGMTGQMLEGFARKALGALAGVLGGGILRGVTSAATGAAMTFAVTYALGNVAKTYYAGGRKISMDDLRATFTRLVEQGKSLFPQYQQEVAARSQSMSVNDILPLIKGSV